MDSPASPRPRPRFLLSRFLAGDPVDVIVAIALDVAVLAAALAAGLLLRFDGDVPRRSVEFSIQVFPLLVLAFVMANALFGVYRTVWNYASVGDVLNLFRANAFVTAVLFFGSLLLTDRSVVEPQFWDEFEAADATSFAGVPYTYELLESTDFARRSLPSLRYVTQAGGRLAPERVRSLAELIRRSPVEVGQHPFGREHGHRQDPLPLLGDDRQRHGGGAQCDPYVDAGVGAGQPDDRGDQLDQVAAAGIGRVVVDQPGERAQQGVRARRVIAPRLPGQVRRHLHEARTLARRPVLASGKLRDQLWDSRAGTKHETLPGARGLSLQCAPSAAA